MTPHQCVRPSDGFAVDDFATWRRRLVVVPALVTPFDPSKRRALVARLKAAGAEFGSLIPSGNWISPYTTFGTGTLVFAPAVVMTNSRFGCFVIVMPNTCVGHDVVLEDFVSVGAGACISGYVTVREGAVVGAGATIINGTSAKPLVIGENARIADGSVVTKTVSDDAHVAGNPARRERRPSSLAPTALDLY